jgi:hypothetical protein
MNSRLRWSLLLLATVAGGWWFFALRWSYHVVGSDLLRVRTISAEVEQFDPAAGRWVELPSPAIGSSGGRAGSG